MEWRVIPDHSAFEVSEAGQVRRCKAPPRGEVHYVGRIKTIKPSRLGYYRARIYRDNDPVSRTAPVHRLVALAFIGPAPSLEHCIAHWDGNPSNNHWTNLRWATSTENNHDRLRHGTMPWGSRHWKAKITEADVVVIRQRRTAGDRVRVIAADYHMSEPMIRQICARRFWAHVP